MSQKQVYIGGSRHLQSSPIIHKFVAKVISQGAIISVGCASGADALTIAAATQQGAASSLRIKTIFSQGGWGAWQYSAVNTVKAAFQKGAQVQWSVGQGLPFNQQLMARSVAGLKGSCCAVFFSPGRGSLKVAAQAIRQGIPVYVFSATAPQFGQASNWQQVSLHGFQCWLYRKDSYGGATKTATERH